MSYNDERVCIRCTMRGHRSNECTKPVLPYIPPPPPETKVEDEDEDDDNPYAKKYW